MNQISRPRSLDLSEVRATVVRLVPEFAKALPPGVDPNRFARVVQTALQQNPKLLECTQDSLWGACMKAAQDGLLPDGREGAIVPRWNGKTKRLEAHWMPMVAGLIAKAKRKGSVASLSAQVVYDGEPFQVLLGDEDRINHVRDIFKVKRGSEIAVYAIATMKDGSKEREVMSWEQVQQVAAVSADRESGDVTNVWKLWPEEMARKSCIRRLSKRLPSLDEADDDFKRAVERVDELYDFGKPAVAAPSTQHAIEHAQTAPEPSFESDPAPVVSHQAPAAQPINRMSSAVPATGGDDIPDWDTPPPPKPDLARNFANRFKQRMADVRDILTREGHDDALVEYNGIIKNQGVIANWDTIRDQRPELDAEMQAEASMTLKLITDSNALPPDDAGKPTHPMNRLSGSELDSTLGGDGWDDEKPVAGGK